MVEPSAGTGSFLRLLPFGSLGYDLEPKCPGVTKTDFLTVKLPANRDIAIIGNPPFGKNSSMAVRFFNHAARQSSVIAFIVPKTFRKSSIQNRLDLSFRLLREVEIPAYAFLRDGKPFNVPAVFQIWVKSDSPRLKKKVETTHPDFEFTTAHRAEFAIQRIGAAAGRVHGDLKRSPSSTYFIRGDVEDAMRSLPLREAAGNTAGNPSLAKSEIVELYRSR